MTYKELLTIGFERIDIDEDINFDRLGFKDFYLSYKIDSCVTFEWNWEEPHFVKRVLYQNEIVINYLKIYDMDILKELIQVYNFEKNFMRQFLANIKT